MYSPSALRGVGSIWNRVESCCICLPPSIAAGPVATAKHFMATIANCAVWLRASVKRQTAGTARWHQNRRVESISIGLSCSYPVSRRRGRAMRQACSSVWRRRGRRSRMDRGGGQDALANTLMPCRHASIRCFAYTVDTRRARPHCAVSMSGPITFGGGGAMSGAGIGSESVNKCSLRPLANLYSESSV